MNKEFFQRATLPFRLLRRSRATHYVNPIEERSVSEITLVEDGKEDPRIAEQVWFLLFFGASTDEISKVFREYRETKKTPRLSFRTGTKDRSQKSAIAQLPKSPPRPYASNTQVVERNIVPTSYGIAQANYSRISQERNHGNHQDVTGQIQQERSSSSQDRASVQGKKGHALESYFRDMKFTGAPEQSVNNLIRDFEICAVQQILDHQQMSLFFVNALADTARQFFPTHYSPSMPFDQIVSQMRRNYNLDTRQLQLHSEMDSLSLSAFMRKQQLTDFSTVLVRLVYYINALAP